ncbi:hypothetical protein THAOC_22493, partial [Thalassiosira oceanica]
MTSDTSSHSKLPGMLTDKLEVDQKVESTLKHLILRTLNGDGSHSMPVCVVCDQFIIGVEEVCSISKEILQKVFDSLGSPSPRHRRYMEGLRRYLFEDLHKDVPESQRPQYYEWSRSWALRNRSGHCPRQTNSYDCGVFTMTTIYLSSRGVAISRDTYDQHFVEAVNLRHNLALALLRVNDMADPSDSQTRLNFQSAASSQTASRKRRREHRVRVGGKRIKTQNS